jgi:antitoxin component of RelBE/YafQ-DinJ toxin-antitoxin module
MKLGVTQQELIDAIFEAISTTTEDIDVILNKLGITVTEPVDTLFQKLGITVTDPIDVLFSKLEMSQYSIDVFLSEMRQIKYDIDTILRNNNIPTSFAIDVILQAIIHIIGGGGYPEGIDYPKIKVEYINFVYHFPVKMLKSISRTIRTLNTNELKLQDSNNKSKSLQVNELDLVKKTKSKRNTAQLAVARKSEQQANVHSLKLTKFVSKTIKVNPMAIVVNENKAEDVAPLDIVKEETVSTVLSSLDMIREYPHSIDISPLEMRKKPNKKRDMLDILSKLDDMDN